MGGEVSVASHFHIYFSVLIVDSIRSHLFDRVVSIAAGRDHLLALTSSGRTFVHPMTKDANSHGQLGFRKFDIPDPSSAGTSGSRLHIELTPRAVADPYAKSSRYSRESRASENLVDDVDDKNLKFSDKFFEVPALRGINVVQIAACARSSFVRTDTGRVLGWGANDYGYVAPYLDMRVNPPFLL
jgi:alpha-tubulin suppressor-like RCC1 family protein